MTTEQAYLSFLQALLHETKPPGRENPDLSASGLEKPLLGDSLLPRLGDQNAQAKEWLRGSQPGLHFYHRSAQNRRLSFLRHVFPKLWNAMNPDERRCVERAWFATPSGEDLDWVVNTSGLVVVLEGLVQKQQCRPVLLSVAQHEWTLFEVGLQPDRPPLPATVSDFLDSAALDRFAATLQVNPTLEVREYPHDPVKLTDGASHVAYFVEPNRKRSRFLVLDPRTLAAMQVVDEAIPPSAAAQAQGISPQNIHQLLCQYVAAGLFTQRLSSCPTPELMVGR